MLKIGIDLDNTINDSSNTIQFFSLLTQLLRPHVFLYIITNRAREEEQKTAEELERYNIFYNLLVITANKQDFIFQEGINIYFDDTDEYFIDLPESVTVFKIREPGNFDFSRHKWVYGDKTGYNIEG